MNETLINQYIDSVLKAVEGPLPPRLVHHARRCFIDYVGATLAGAAMDHSRLVSIQTFLGDDRGSASVMGLGRKASLPTAALLNGIASHTVEMDDGVISGIIHPGSPIFSAMLPVAQAKYGICGEDFLRGIVAGYEACVRISNAIQPSHKLRGWHATGTCGALGAVFAILVMTRASHKTIKHALSAAAVSASGTLKVVEGNSELKPFNAGHAAQSAITAVALAEAGYRGPDDVFTGMAGLLEMMAGGYDPAKLVPALSSKYAIDQVYFKPYASCRYCHPPIEGAIQLRDQVAPVPDGIVSIHVDTYELAVKHHDHTAVDNASSAKMSIPYGVATGIIYGSAGIEYYTEEAILQPIMVKLMRKVSVTADPEFTKAFPAETAARVTITLADGRSHSAEIREPKGNPANPLSDKEVSAKFRDLATAAGKSKDWCDEFLNHAWALPEDLDAVIRML